MIGVGSALISLLISAMPYAQAKRNARDPGIERFVRNVQQDL